MNIAPVIKAPNRPGGTYENFEADEEQRKSPPAPKESTTSFIKNTFIETSPRMEDIVFFQAEGNGFDGVLKLGTNGENFLTFNNPPEEYTRELYQAILKEALELETQGKQIIIAEEMVTTEEVILPIQEASAEFIKPQEAQKEQNTKKYGLREAMQDEIKNLIPAVKKTAQKIAETLSSFFSSMFELFTGDFLQIEKTKRPQTAEEKAAAEKKTKQNENKRNFFQKLSMLLRPKEIGPALLQEVIKTNQFNSLQEQYMGIVDSTGNIDAYHKANRIQKEAEAKAHRITAERAAKKAQGPKKKGPGQPVNRQGELLMGAENPSHFTKALG